MIIVTSRKHRIERFILYIILYIIYYKRKYIYKCKYTNVLDLNSSLYLAKFFIPTLISESVSMPSPQKNQKQMLLLELHLHVHSLSRCLMIDELTQCVTATECDSDTHLLFKDDYGNFDSKSQYKS